MGLAEGSAPSARPAPPDQDLEALRTAFAEEVTARLGPLNDAARELADSGSAEAARVVLLHACTLASSAVPLGEDLAAYHARKCEQVIAPYVDSGADPVPLEAAREAAAAAATLGVLLGPWLLGADDHVG